MQETVTRSHRSFWALFLFETQAPFPVCAVRGYDYLYGMQATPRIGETPRQIFLSHAGLDSVAASDLAQILRCNGLAVWFDKDSLLPGVRWMETMEQAIQQSSVMLVYVGRLGVQAYVDREVRLGLERNIQDPDSFSIVPVLGPGSDPASLPPFLRQHQFVDLRDAGRAPEEIGRLLDTLADPRGRAAVKSEYWETHGPFRSLETFKPEDSWLFFGRDSEIQELLQRLAKAPVLTVLGNSGSGKSSLVLAGLVPALQRGRFEWRGAPVDTWRIAIVRPSNDPFHYLAEALPRQLAPNLPPSEREQLLKTWRRTLPTGGDSLRNALVTAVDSSRPEGDNVRVLLVVDQFEEIFTSNLAVEIRQAYIDLLLNAADFSGALQVHVVLTMRADFYSHCLNHRALSSILETNTYNVPGMTRNQLRESIEKRLTLSGARMEQGLIETLLNDAGSEPGNLALLEHALGELWVRRIEPGRMIDTSAYTRLNGLRGALRKHADDVFARVETDEGRKLVSAVFLELVQLGDDAPDTRRRVPKRDLLSLGDAATVERILGTLASERLITTARNRTGGEEIEYVEVGHEALIRDWPQLVEWINRSREDLKLRRHLEQQAAQWSSVGRDSGALLRGGLLSIAQDWLESHPEATRAVKEYVEVSGLASDREAREERERRRLQLVRTRRFLYAILGLLCMAAAALVSVWREAQVARSQALASRVDLEISYDRAKAFEDAIQAWSVNHTAEAKLAVGRAFPQLLATLSGHLDRVNQANFSPDNRRIVTASADQSARVWDAASGELLATLREGDAEVTQAQFTPDGRRVVAVSKDRTVRLWDASSGSLIASAPTTLAPVEFTIEEHDIVIEKPEQPPWDPITGAMLPTGGIVTSGRPDAISVGSLLRGDDERRAHTLVGWKKGPWPYEMSFPSDRKAMLYDPGMVFSAPYPDPTGNYLNVSFSPDGKRIVTYHATTTAWVWDVVTGGRIATLNPYSTATVTRADFSSDGKRIVTVSSDGTARLWDAATGALSTQLEGLVNTASRISFSPDGRLIAGGGDDYTARVWLASNGRQLATLGAHAGKVTDAAFSPDGKRIVTASADQTARVWSLTSSRLVAVLNANADDMSWAAFSPDGERIVTASDGYPTMEGFQQFQRRVLVWSAKSGKMLARLTGPTSSVHRATFSSDGRQVVAASGDGTARVWNAADGKTVAVLRGHSDDINEASIAHDGKRVVTASEDGTVRLWQAIGGRLLMTVTGNHGEVTQANFSPDDRRLVTANRDGTAQLWNTDTGELLATLRGHTGPLTSAVFSPNGVLVATAGADRTARVWAAKGGSPSLILTGHTEAVTGVAFSPDSQRVVTSSEDATARVWNAVSGKLLATLKGHLGPVNQVCFSPDGRWIVTSSRDATARLWDAADGQLLAPLGGHNGSVNHASLSPDSQRIVTASADGTARVYKIVTLTDLMDLLSH